MRYADPHACPACRGAIAGEPRCPHCDFDLGSDEARRLWALFQQADALVARGRARATTPTPAPSGDGGVAAAPGSGDQHPRWEPATPVAAPGSWSTGTVLLGLGAVCLVVAALIFATVAWGSLGIVGRALILLALTALVGLAARRATLRRLIGTAESLWSVFVGFLTVDVLAAVAEGLFGLAWRDFAAVSVVWTALLVVIGVVLARWSGRTVDRELRMPQLAAGCSTWVSAPAVLFRLGELRDDHWFWAALVATLVPVAAVVVARRRGLRWMLWPAVAAAGVLGLVCVLFAVAEAFAGTPVLTVGDAAPTVTLALVALVVAGFLPRLRAILTATAGAGVLLLVGVGAGGVAWRLDLSAAMAMVAVALAVALIAVLVVRPDAWGLGLRWAALGGGAAVLCWIAIVTVISHLSRADEAASIVGTDPWARPIYLQVLPGPWVLAAGLGLLPAWWGTRRWASPRVAPAAWWTPSAALLVGASAATAVAATTLPFLVHAVVLAGVAAALAVLVRRAPGALELVPIAVALAAVVVVPAEGAAAVWAGGAAALGLAVCAAVGWDHRDADRRTISAIATGLGSAIAIWTALRAAALADLGTDLRTLLVAGLAVGALLIAMGLDEVPHQRRAVEIVAAVTYAASCVVADDLVDLSVILTMGAAACAVVGLLDGDRGWLRWVGAGLIGAAWVARLAAAEVDVVEAYTAPFALAVLAAGLWRLRHEPAARTWIVLTPGLTLALLPSLPQALAEPTGLRAGLLGLGALVVLAAGVVLRWGAPVVGGSVVLLLIVLANVGPTALALPRWLLIAAVGLVMLVVGTTWERRVAEGRAVVARLRTLR